MKETTIPHIVKKAIELEYGINIEFPEEIKGDLEKEHDYLIWDEAGPSLSKNYEEHWSKACEEIDHLVDDGTVYFNCDNGIVVYLQ